MAFTSMAALIGGAEASAALVLGAMAEVGTAMSVVGAVTGNKTLMKIGGVIGLVGGVGGMINGAMGGAAGAAGGAAEAGVDAALDAASGEAMAAYGGEAAASAATDAAIAGMEQGSIDSVMSSAGGNFGQMVDEAQRSLGDYVNSFDKMNDPAQLADAAGEKLKTMGTSPTPASDSIVQSAQAPTGPSSPTGPSAPQTPSDAGVPDAINRAKDSQKVYDSVANAGKATDSGSYFSKILGWAKENPTLSNSVMTLGGGLLKGMGEASMVQKKLDQQQSQFNTMYGHANEVASYGPKPTSILQTARA